MVDDKLKRYMYIISIVCYKLLEGKIKGDDHEGRGWIGEGLIEEGDIDGINPRTCLWLGV